MTTADEKLIKIIQDGIKDMKLRDRILVKPLTETIIEMEIEKPIYKEDENGEIIKDENGFHIYDSTEKVIESVPSAYRKGIVIKTPFNIDMIPYGVKEGDTILYPTMAANKFDQLKDSVFIAPHNIVAVYE